MVALEFDKRVMPSERFGPGVWLITRCIENDHVVGIDLGWNDAGIDGEYRHVGYFIHESEALFAIRALETLPSVQDIMATISEAGFVEHRPTGLSYGQEPYVRQIREGALSALLHFDDVNGTRLCLSLFEGRHTTVEIATLRLDTDGTMLARLGRPEVVAAAVLCALLKARLEDGDPTRPFRNLPLNPTSSV